MSVREFSRIKTEVSTSGALILFRGGESGDSCALPFSTSENRRAI